ncbi:BTB domain-containing protein [Trichostrongylus colubriformis]|uniref:BTB domain-containing protein n=1 Tax=Trichostrongylus colubriformis TaxID=6319 RepID=A0AAN8IUT8_TRICO
MYGIRTTKAENNAHNREVESSSHKPFLLAQLHKFRNESRLCDVTLVVKGTRINAHRLVLAASSKYFEAMFTIDMVESREHDIEMIGVEAGTLSALVYFCYSGKVNIDDNNVLDTLAAACLLQLDEVKVLCCDFLKKGICVSKCLEIRGVAETYACQTLLHFANEFILLNFQHIISLEGFHHLLVEQVTELISSDVLVVRSEEQVFDAVIKWINFDLTTRKSLLSQLLQHVRLPLCQPKFLVDVVSKNAQELSVATNVYSRSTKHARSAYSTKNPLRDMVAPGGGATTNLREEWTRSRVRVTPVRRLSRATP